MRNTRKKKGKGWSAKYKQSINCHRPKGFSQKQYCKYGRKRKTRRRRKRKTHKKKRKKRRKTRRRR